MPVAGSFMRVTGEESADVAAASAFSLPRIPNIDCRLDMESKKITKFFSFERRITSIANRRA